MMSKMVEVGIMGGEGIAGAPGQGPVLEMSINAGSGARL